MTPVNETVNATPPHSDTVTFTIASTEATAEQIGYTISCSGAAVECHDLSGFAGGAVGPLSSSGPSSATVAVAYHVSAGSRVGTITLAARGILNGAATATGSRIVTVTDTSKVFADVRSANAGAVVARDQCVTIPAASQATYQCGDLVIEQPLPTTMTFNQPRTPVLQYNSREAAGFLFVAANIGVAAGVTPTSLSAHVGILNSSGVQIRDASMPFSWTSANSAVPVSRIVVPVGVGFLGTGAYKFTFQIMALSGSTVLGVYNDTGTVVYVDRSSTDFGTQFGRGWWLEGFEQLVGDQTPAANQKLWIGGDGNARVYTQVAGTNTWLVAPTVDRPDTLRYFPDSLFWRRSAPNGSLVYFDPTGREIASQNVEGQRTAFEYDSVGHLSAFTLPVASGTRPRYTFTNYFDSLSNNVYYNVLGPAVGFNRSVQVVNDVPDHQFYITDEDGQTSVLNYDNSYLVSSRSDKLARITNFIYIGGGPGLLASTSVQMPSGQPAIVRKFCPAEVVGAHSLTNAAAPCPTGPVDVSLVRTLYDGPRTDIADTTAFYVDRFEAPVKVVDALGAAATIERTDPRWPLLPTAAVAPNGHRTESYFNARALPDSTREINPLGDGQNAVARFTWDTKWSAPTSVTSPTGQVSSTQYDPTFGRVQFEQVGSNASRRVQYNYSSTGSLQSVTPPAPMGATTYEYDTLGNLSATVSPSGLRSTVTRDAIGRVASATTPIDSLASSTVKRIQAYQYDAMDRPTMVIDSAPAFSGSSSWQSIHVTTSYDKEGRDTAVTRHAFPDAASLGDVVNVTQYDPADRVTKQYDPNHRQNQITYAYDPTGKSVTMTRPTGTQTVDLDVLGRPRHIAISGIGGATATADDQIFAYDNLGDLTAANNRYAQVGRAYYPNGALKSDTLRIAATDLSAGSDFSQHQYVLAYGYDLDGRLTSLTHPSQLAVPGLFGTTTYDYDPETGAFQHIADPAVGTFAYFYGLAGMLDSLVKPDGTKESYAYRTNGLPLTRSEVGGSSTAYHSDAFNFDGRTKMLRTQSTTFGTPITSAFTYAGLGAALSASGPTPSSQAETYTRDPLGNVLTSSVAATSWQGNFTDRYSPHTTQLSGFVGTPAANTLDSVIVVRDSAGNVIRRDEHIRMPANCAPQAQCDPPQPDVLAFSSLLNGFTGDGRLRSSEMTTSNDNFAQIDTTAVAPFGAMGRGVSEEYRYDALGRRVWRRAVREPFCTDVDPRVEPICLSYIERTVYDGDQVLYEIRQLGADTVAAAVMESDGAPVNSFGDQFGVVAYLNGDATDAPLALGRLSVSGIRAVVLHRDFQGSVDFATVLTAESLIAGGRAR